MSRMMSTTSRPLSVRVYSVRMGNAVASTDRVMISSSSTPRVPVALVEFEDDEQRPPLGKVPDRLADRTGILHGMVLETLQYL